MTSQDTPLTETPETDAVARKHGYGIGALPWEEVDKHPGYALARSLERRLRSRQTEQPAPERPAGEMTSPATKFSREMREAIANRNSPQLLHSVDKLPAEWLAICDAIESAESQVAKLKGEIEALTHEGRQGELEQANVGLANENERLREGLRFYAHGDHWINELHDDKWDTCSGEPQNWHWRDNEEDSAEGIEDGGIAQVYLSGNRPDWEGEPPLEHPCEPVMKEIAKAKDAARGS